MNEMDGKTYRNKYTDNIAVVDYVEELKNENGKTYRVVVVTTSGARMELSFFREHYDEVK